MTGFLIGVAVVFAVFVPLFVFWGLRTNAQNKPARFVPGFRIGVASWNEKGKRAKPHWEVDGLDEACSRAYAALSERFGKATTERIMDFDVWFYPLKASRLSVATGPRTSGTVHPYYNNWGFRMRRCVRIRDLERGDITKTAFAHQIAWHLVLMETGRGPNLLHDVDMSSLEREIR